VVVENASHMVMMERPDIVNRLIQDFLDDVIAAPVTSASSKQRLYPARRNTVSQSVMSLKSLKSIPNTDALVTSNLK